MGKIDNTIIGKFFWDRCTQIDNHEEYKKIRDEYRKKSKANIKKEKIENFFESNIDDNDKAEELKKLLSDYSEQLLHEISFESLFFYKLGFKDGYSLYKELEEIKA